MKVFTVELLSPERALYRGPATMVIAPGAEGEIGILPHHMPLLTKLKEGTIKILVNHEPEIELQISSGYLETVNDVCSIVVTSTI